MGAAILHIHSFILGLFPESLVVLLARFWGTVWFVLIRYRRKVLLENIGQAFPELSAEEQRALGHRACVHLVRSLFELFRTPRYRKIGFEHFVRIEGLEHYEEAKKAGKGVFCLSGHLGSSDFCVGAVARYTAPISLLVKPFPPAVDGFITKMRRDSGLGVIYPGGALKEIVRALKNNETIVAVLDQNATRQIGIFVDFFGRSACTMSYLASFAMTTGAQVVPAKPYRDTDGKHVLRICPPIPLEKKGTRKETIAHMTGKYTKFIEDAIREHPEQWFWHHKRWRTRPAPPAKKASGFVDEKNRAMEQSDEAR